MKIWKLWKSLHVEHRTNNKFGTFLDCIFAISITISSQYYKRNLALKKTKNGIQFCWQCNTTSIQIITIVYLDQGYATLYGSCLVDHIGNKIVYAGQYKYHNDLFDLTFEIKRAFSGPLKNILKGIFKYFINLNNVRGPH